MNLTDDVINQAQALVSAEDLNGLRELHKSYRNAASLLGLYTNRLDVKLRARAEYQKLKAFRLAQSTVKTA